MSLPYVWIPQVTTATSPPRYPPASPYPPAVSHRSAWPICFAPPSRLSLPPCGISQAPLAEFDGGVNLVAFEEEEAAARAAMLAKDAAREE